MKATDIAPLIAKEINCAPGQVTAVSELLDSGNTVPFIARYRKEATSGLDEEKIRSVEERLTYLRNLLKRQEEILAAIAAQEKLTPELAAAIENAMKLQELEDLYLPFRPKKRTRAQAARELGLEPLAERMLAQRDAEGLDKTAIAAAFVGEDKAADIAAALAGARDIIAEQTTERADLRAQSRRLVWQQAELAATLAVEEKEAPEFLTYRDYREPVRRMPPHRILAINRGEKRGALAVTFEFPQENIIDALLKAIVTGPSLWRSDVEEAVADGAKRLLFPSLEREIRNQLTETAEKQAINIFGRNLKQLLLSPPLAGHTVIGFDPGYRTGCKVAVVNPQGTVLATTVIYVTHSDAQKQKAAAEIAQLVRKHRITLAVIGNGTASYETEAFVSQLIQDEKLDLHYLIVNEAGASVYSASKLAKDELPDLDVTLRGAVSIARRIQDPLAELVKIEPKAIGVGQYQHDVNQKELTGALDTVIESAVNHVGVDLNTASIELLKHVAGVSATVAKNIVSARDENGPFPSRKALLKVPRLGPSTFEQCAGFLRLPQSEQPLDRTPVHPESYALAEHILQELGFTPDSLSDKSQLTALQQAVAATDAARLAGSLGAGEPTVRDILDALAKPGRDPREDLPLPMTRKKIMHLEELLPGTVLPGTVHNVTDFGAFVDIGVKVNGLVHRSELSKKPIRHPMDAVSVGDQVTVVILSVDAARNRIALSIKQVPDSSV